MLTMEDSRLISRWVIGAFVLEFSLILVTGFIEVAPAVDDPVHLFTGDFSGPTKSGDVEASWRIHDATLKCSLSWAACGRIQ